jgi:CheY-like chemotaxis protein
MKSEDLESEGCVLVVDDEREFREMVVMALTDEGYAVTTASGGAAALESLRRHRPRLILLDYTLGDLTGAQVAAAYRQMPAPHCPIIVMTASMDAAQRAVEVGAQDLLAKPFDLEALLQIVARWRDAKPPTATSSAP